MKEIIGGIVTFNPDIDRLEENIIACQKQIEKVIIIDNNSKNHDEIVSLVRDKKKISIISLNKNMGIAYALNELLLYSKNMGYKWMLTLDQDSVICDGLIEKYDLIKNKDEKIAMLTCVINDRNFGVDYGMDDSNRDYEYVKQCITSGNLVCIDKLAEVDGFDDTLFIDYVDFDICKRVQLAGYKIVKANINGLLHEVGNAKVYGKEDKRKIVYNHSAFRHYYQARNRVYYFRKYKKNLGKYEKITLVSTQFVKCFDIIRHEDNKKDKINCFLKGIRAGISIPINGGSLSKHEGEKIN